MHTLRLPDKVSTQDWFWEIYRFSSGHLPCHLIVLQAQVAHRFSVSHPNSMFLPALQTLAASLDVATRPADKYFNKLVRILTTRCMTQALYFGSGDHGKSRYTAVVWLFEIAITWSESERLSHHWQHVAVWHMSVIQNYMCVFIQSSATCKCWLT